MNTVQSGKHKTNVDIEISPRKRHKSVKAKSFQTMDENKNPQFSNTSDAATMMHIENDCDENLTIKDGNISIVNDSNQTDFETPHNVASIFSMCDPDMANDTNVSSLFDATGHSELDLLQSTEIYIDNGQREGRPILNTSLLKLAAQNQQQRAGRSPLTTMVCNKNAVTQTHSTGPLEQCCSLQRKQMASCGDEFFHYYQQKLPQGYFGPDNFTKLSDEMVLSVFKWLPKKALIRCCLVNRRFNNVAQDESLWGRLDMSCKQIRSGAFANILSRGVVIFRLAQSKIADPIWNISDIGPDFTTKLQYLDLSMAVVSKQALDELLSRCRRLKKLSLEHVALDSNICVEIAANKNLEALNLAMCEGIDARSIRQMMNDLKVLQSLNISWTHMKFDTLTTFVECVPSSLVRLNIAGCRKQMTDSHLTALVRRCPNLIELDLSDCTLLTSDSVKIICKCKNLEYLSLSRCYSITVSAYLSINELMSLEYLDIFGVLSESAILMLQTTFPTVGINKFIHSAVARPTVGSRRTSIWGLRTRD